MQQSSNKVRVLSYLEQQPHPVHWAIIAEKLGIKPTSTRSILSRLVKAGQIERAVRGLYCNKRIGGLSRELPRIHSLQMLWKPLNIVAADMNTMRYITSSWDFLRFEPRIEKLGPVRIKVGRDLRRHTISGFLGHEGTGMDLDLFRVALLSWRLMVRDLTKQMPALNQIKVTNMQLNYDLEGIRIEGASAVTVYSVLGVMERYYNKADRVRAEIQATPKSVQDIQELLRGGVPHYELVQTNFMLARQLRELNHRIDESMKLNGLIYRTMIAILEKTAA